MIVAISWWHMVDDNVFAWTFALMAVMATVAIAGMVVYAVIRMYKIHLIHQERMAMIDKGMDPGPFVEGTEEAEDEEGAERPRGQGARGGEAAAAATR
jgi:hypothetical protein